MSYCVPILDSAEFSSKENLSFCEGDLIIRSSKENLFCGAAMAAEARVPPQLAVVDVYESASLIGNEFERLIEQYGTERYVLSSLCPHYSFLFPPPPPPPPPSPLPLPPPPSLPLHSFFL